jgi:hypothetical protein
MQRTSLAAHKKETKILEAAPTFSHIKRGKLPRPLHQMGGPRIQSTPMLPVASNYSACFMWKDGETLEQAAFYGFLYAHVGQNRNLYPICELHFHPSHKDLHVKTPCDSDLDYTNRGLPGAKELCIKGNGKRFDPRNEQHRAQLIEIFCKVCGIQFGKKSLI